MMRMPCWIACLAALQLAAGTACAASPWEDPSRIRSTAVDWVRSQTPDHVTVRASALDSRLQPQQYRQCLEYCGELPRSQAERPRALDRARTSTGQ